MFRTLLLMSAVFALSCSTTPPPASTSEPASASTPAPKTLTPTCDTLRSRLAGPTRDVNALTGFMPVLAQFESSGGVSVASAISKTEFTTVTSLRSGAQVPAKMHVMRALPAHPNVAPAKGMLDRGRANQEMRGQLFVVLYDAQQSSVRGYLPAVDEAEGRALGALLEAKTCAGP